MNERPALPNFFIVGAPKAGTTSLCHHLGQHPGVYLSPVKESLFFAEEARTRPDVERMVRRIQRHLDGPMRGRLPTGQVGD